jgi:26S proteasome regulatory subunit N10
MRNGDYSPSRLTAQSETVNYLSNAKTQGNMESAVGFLTMGGGDIRVHSTLTRNLGRIMNALAKDVHCDGTCNFIGGLKTAQLALKNRQNKNQRQRIVMFVGSPVQHEQKALERLGKQLKKNNVAVDIINFGSENFENENVALLEAFQQAVDRNENSRLIHVHPGTGIMSDLVMTSGIMMESGSAPAAAAATPAAAAGAGAGAGAGSFPGGVDPNLDPEMAMVLRMSLEEERARQQAAVASSSGDAMQTESAAAGSGSSADAAGDDGDEDEYDEDALLQQALMMSMQMNQPSESSSQPAAAAAATTTTNADNKASDMDVDVNEAFQDEAFVKDLLTDAGIDEDDLLGLLDEDDDDDADKDKPAK